MKILHVSHWDNKGGAAVAAERIHRELLNRGAHSRMLVEIRGSSTEGVEQLNSGIGWLSDRLQQEVIRRFQHLQKDPGMYFHSTNFRRNRLVRVIKELNPDVVHLHWMGNGLLRIEDLKQIQTPIVWTIHDMWPFCGSEHYTISSPERWESGYSDENRDKRARGPDLSRWTWERKRDHWKNVEIISICPSNWIKDCIEKSALWGSRTNCHHYLVHNGLDLTNFKPARRSSARDALGLPKDRPVLLVGSYSLEDKIKGVDLVVKAAEELQRRIPECLLASFGKSPVETGCKLETRHLGYISSQETMAMLYNAADVTIVPSRKESFGQVAAESIACGTPVACFDTSGLRDVVDHQINGFRAECFSPSSLVEGVFWCLRSGNRGEEGLKAAREKALGSFDITQAVRKIRSVYSEAIARGQTSAVK